MDTYKPLFLEYFQDNDRTEFNLVGIPDELILQLSFSLRKEWQNRMSKSTQSDFAVERRLQNERYKADCKRKGFIPGQMFIDLKND